MTLANLFFFRDAADTYFTGQIVAEVEPGVYAVRYDLSDISIPPPLELVEMSDLLTICDDCGSKAWKLFTSREALQAYLDWLGSPDLDDDSAVSPGVAAAKKARLQ
ncbi:MAG TPA: hypothetical protein VMS08_02795 [Candidatus Saccharimonadia bacterium]|nr:hypothetical protein [Candidatus Saccharimonadia bacterium]